jgi:hypothetical protein
MTLKHLPWLLLIVSIAGGAFEVYARMGLDVSSDMSLSQEVEDTLLSIYKASKNEFAFCLYGSDGPVVEVEKLELVEMLEATSNMGVITNCSDKSSLGIGHSHTRGLACHFSNVDWYTLKKYPYKYGFLLCTKSNGMVSLIKYEK